MQVIHGRNGVVGVNNSYAGSTVSGNLATSATAENRLRALGKKGDPDVILLAMGANDWGFCVLPQEFVWNMAYALSVKMSLIPRQNLVRNIVAGKGWRNRVFLMRNRPYRRKSIRRLSGRRPERQKYIWRMWPGMASSMKRWTASIQQKKEMQTIAGLWLKEMKEEKKEKKGGCVFHEETAETAGSRPVTVHRYVILPTAEAQVQATTPRMNYTSLTLKQGKTKKLKVKGCKAKKIRWTSSNEKVVTVNEKREDHHNKRG